MASKSSVSSLLVAWLSLSALGFTVACGSDGDSNSNASSGGMAGANTGTGGKTSGTGGAGHGGSGVDYTTCQPQTCDSKAVLAFDFSGPWHESLVFKSNDCDTSLQAILPKDFTQEAAVLSDVIEGNCVRPTPESTMFTGSIALDLSGAQYCTTSTQRVEAAQADVPLISHVTWKSIEPKKITGTSSVYVSLAGCTLTGDYSLTRD
ncbi:MAG: hypothetical protein ACOY0T_27395 [Myxococcota bacterium]